MRHFKIFLAAFALIFSSSIYAFDSDNKGRKRSVSSEIENMLKQSDLTIDESFTVTVIFRITEEKRIEIQKVSSPNEEVNLFLIRRLDNQKLHDPEWNSKKVYKLPIRVHSRR